MTQVLYYNNSLSNNKNANHFRPDLTWKLCRRVFDAEPFIWMFIMLYKFPWKSEKFTFACLKDFSLCSFTLTRFLPRLKIERKKETNNRVTLRPGAFFSCFDFLIFLGMKWHKSNRHVWKLLTVFEKKVLVRRWSMTKQQKCFSMPLWRSIFFLHHAN